MKKIYTTIIAAALAICPAGINAQPGIPCNPNTFWGFNAGQIEEWEINGTAVTSNGIVVTATAPSNSLAFCDNLSGGTFSPTFYAHSGSNAVYFDGTSWVTAPPVSICSLSNAAGAGNYLYYNQYGLGCLNRFDGIAFTNVLSGSNLVFTIADLAVDDAGNAWCLMGYNTPDTDSIMVISPAGQIIKQYAFSMNTLNGYGSFLMNGVLYVGLGGSNPVYPNTLLPISFTATAAIPGTPISFTISSPDLASCNAGTPLSVMQHHLPANGMIVYPNIAADYINCVMQVKINATVNVRITNALGNTVYSSPLRVQGSELHTKIDISSYSKGIYFIEITNACLPDRQGEERSVRKFIKN